MPGKIENAYGNIIMPVDVIARMAGIAATQCYGVVGMASRNKTDGLVSLLKKEHLNRGVKVTIEDNLMIIDLHIMVEYGVNIAAICENIVSNVKYKVESMTGLKVKKINVFVESIRVEE